MGHIEEELIERIEEACRRSFRRICAADLDYSAMAREFVSEQRCEEQFELLERLVPDPMAGKRMLEVGSGYGMFIVTARQRHAVEAFGVEPGEQFQGAFELSQRLLANFGLPSSFVKQGKGEAIPYPDGSFDLVYSCNVLEHVENPAQVLTESIRVLRSGGRLIIIVPNYGSWWEGHYGILFPPHCPKWLFKIMVRSIGRNPTFVDTLQFVTYRQLRNWLAPHMECIRVLSYGEDIWEERMRTLAFSTWGSVGKLKKMVRWVHWLRLVEPVVWLGRRLHWETPIILVVEKT